MQLDKFLITSLKSPLEFVLIDLEIITSLPSESSGRVPYREPLIVPEESWNLMSCHTTVLLPGFFLFRVP